MAYLCIAKNQGDMDGGALELKWGNKGKAFVCCC